MYDFFVFFGLSVFFKNLFVDFFYCLCGFRLLKAF